MTNQITFNNGRTYTTKFEAHYPKHKRYFINGLLLGSEASYMRELKRITIANCEHAKRVTKWSPFDSYNGRAVQYAPMTKRGKCDKCGLLVTPKTI